MRNKLTVLIVALALVTAAAQNATPAAAAIQTQIAGLEATLTAIAGTPVATLSAANSVEYIGSGYYPFRHRIAIDSIVIISGGLHNPTTNAVISPRGVFVALSLKFTNLSNDPVSGWDDYDVLLRDEKGRALSPDNDASFALTEQRGIFVYVFQPGLPYEQVLVYDVAPDAKTFAAEIKHTTIHVPLGQPGA